MSAPVIPEIEYPDSDGQPMAENTLQFDWIVTIKSGLDELFRDRPDVFVAGDLLWYPVRGSNTVRTAPDALVAFGRPKGYRGSYQQWEEGGIAPQVVFEVLSPGNRAGELREKLAFYERYGVEEYYVYDPFRGTLQGWQRSGNALQEISQILGWVSPRLRVRFDLSGDDLLLTRPDGRPFVGYLEVAAERDRERHEKEAARQLADQLAAQREQEQQARAAAEREREQERLAKEAAERQREQERQARAVAEREREQERLAKEAAERQREQEKQRSERLAAQLRALGIDPEA